MAKFTKEKQKTFDFINAAVTLCDNFPKLQFSSTLESLSLGSFDFLLNIIKTLGFVDKIPEWLTNLLTVALPPLELAIKAKLLLNLKQMMFCDIDPRIPEEYRLLLRDYDGEEYINMNRGIYFDIHAIDYTNMLDISPLTDYGKNRYFGVDNITSPYQLLRAEDMNAFLWVVYNKGHFPNPKQISSIQDIHPNAQGTTVLHPVYINNVQQENGLVLGNTFQINGSSVVNICFSEIKNEEGGQTMENNPSTNILQRNTTRKYSYTVLPFSSNNVSANWFVNRDTYYDFLTPNKKHKERDYSKDFGLFNLAYITDTNVHSGMMKFTILPKPFVHMPHKGEPAWRIQRILFDADGIPDSKGNYTVKTNSTKAQVSETEITYPLDGATLVIDVKSGQYRLEGINDEILPKVLFPCYKGLTVYEFNYDFVMGVKLFDAKTIISQIMETTFNFSAGLNVTPRITYLSTETQYRITEVIRKMMMSDETEVTDCYFTFNNDEENAMSEKAEQLKAGGYAFNGSQNMFSSFDPSEIINTLNEISDDATLEENTQIIQHAFEQITANITKEIPGEEGTAIQFNIIYNIVVNLVLSIVCSLLSPKIILLFLINNQMMGDGTIYVNIEAFIQAIWNLILAIIKEVINLIIQNLLEFILSLLKPLLACITEQMLLEQIDAYRRLIKLIINECTIDLNGTEYESLLDTVVGADIYENRPEQPQTDECS